LLVTPVPGSSTNSKSKEDSHEAETVVLTVSADLFVFRLQHQERETAEVRTVVLKLK